MSWETTKRALGRVPTAALLAALALLMVAHLATCGDGGADAGWDGTASAEGRPALSVSDGSGSAVAARVGGVAVSPAPGHGAPGHDALCDILDRPLQPRPATSVLGLLGILLMVRMTRSVVLGTRPDAAPPGSPPPHDSASPPGVQLLSIVCVSRT